MKRYPGTEMAALALAAVLFVGGASMVIWPPSGPIVHTSDSGIATFDKFTLAKSRSLGVMAMALGAGLAAITVNRKNP